MRLTDGQLQAIKEACEGTRHVKTMMMVRDILSMAAELLTARATIDTLTARAKELEGMIEDRNGIMRSMEVVKREAFKDIDRLTASPPHRLTASNAELQARVDEAREVAKVVLESALGLEERCIMWLDAELKNSLRAIAKGE
jgi:hypothetical protein